MANARHERDLGLTVAQIITAGDIAEAEATEPETTASERRLHGDLAGVVKLLREASSATEDAFALVARRRKSLPRKQGKISKVQHEALDLATEQTWKAKAETRVAFQDVAAIPPQLFKR